MKRVGLREQEQRAIQVLIADDHELARAGLISMLAGEPGIQIVGEAANGRQAVELCRRLQPRVALVDIRMPEMNGLAATRAIKESCPKTSVIILTMYENPDYLAQAVSAGAAGYLLKDVTRSELIRTIRKAVSGETVMVGDLFATMLHAVRRDSKDLVESCPAYLTPREREVLRLISKGQTNSEIANTLLISRGTAKVHVEHIIEKLGVSDRTQAAVRAVQMGLLQGL